MLLVMMVTDTIRIPGSDHEREEKLLSEGLGFQATEWGPESRRIAPACPNLTQVSTLNAFIASATCT